MIMTARMKNPATFHPDVLQALIALGRLGRTGAVPETTLELTHLRVSQINGCASCIHSGIRNARRIGVDEDQLGLLAAWPESPAFSEAERAALDLAEHMTRMGDRSDPVPDPVWQRAAAHYDEQGLATLVLWIATTNLYNRINVTTRQTPGAW
jgi:AhpD family alkylhydroperoxidase